MKVVQINSVCGVGSTGRIAVDISEKLTKLKVENYIAYGRGDSNNQDNTIKIGGKINNYSHLLDTRIFDKHGLSSDSATNDFIKKLEEINPDIVHIHNIHGYYVNFKILFEYLNQKKVQIVWTLHDCWSFTGHCAHFDYIKCEKWMTECNKCPLKKSYPASIMFDNSKKNFLIKKKTFTNLENLTLVMPSKWLKQKVEKSFFKSKKKYVINNGVDLNKFKPTNLEKKEDKFVILCVANVWTKEKGINFIEELSCNLEQNEVIKIVGLNKKQISKFKNNKKIESHGSLKDQKELAEIYSKANVFFNPTYNDTFPTTNIEAIASGIPVITFNTGGSGEIIDDECGFIVEKDDMKSVKKAISEIKLEKKDFNKNARARAVEYFEKDRKIMEYIDLYNNLYSKSR